MGSTGNLGLAVGIMGKALGMRVTVHVSDACKTWKKDILSQTGAEVTASPTSHSNNQRTLPRL